MLFNVLLIFVLILLNGVFAGAEMALMTARRSRLKTMANEGSSRAETALAIKDEPSNFLATVQIGITLVGSLAAAVGGAEVVRLLEPYLESIPYVGAYAHSIALGIIVLAITYTSLVLGELVPKRIAIHYAERISVLMVRPLQWLIRIAYIPTRILAFSADAVVSPFGVGSEAEESASTEEEIEMIVQEAADEGTIEEVEERLIYRVFEYAERHAWDVITPRTAIVALDVNSSPAEALDLAKEHGYSRFPVYENNLDHILGYVHVKDLIWAQEEDDLHSSIRSVTFLPSGTDLPDAFAALTKAGQHLAIVVDEFGGTQGLITLEDILEVVFGEIEDEHSPFARIPKQQAEDEWLIAGSTPLTTVSDVLETELPEDSAYTTLGGFLLSAFGAVPQEGESIEKSGYRFTIEEMEHLRIATVRVKQMEAPVEVDDE